MPALSVHPYQHWYHCDLCYWRFTSLYSSTRWTLALHFPKWRRRRLFSKVHRQLFRACAKAQSARSAKDKAATVQHKSIEERHAYSTLPRNDLEPERDLWRAVLVSAIEDLIGIGPDKTGKDHIRLKNLGRIEAVTWLSSDSMEVSSFRWICGQLGLDPATARRSILRASRDELLQRLKTPEPRKRSPGWNWADPVIEGWKMRCGKL